MGTNYYLNDTSNRCPYCGRGDDEPRHIGKSSAGWCFSLHVIPELGIKSLGDWVDRWSKDGVEIVDEYGEVIATDDMLKTITGRKWHGREIKGDAWYSMNEAEPGPNGLARHRINRFCIGHGDGTYDYLVGEFS